jgi:hypothetical protein
MARRGPWVVHASTTAIPVERARSATMRSAASRSAVFSSVGGGEGRVQHQTQTRMLRRGLLVRWRAGMQPAGIPRSGFDAGAPPPRPHPRRPTAPRRPARRHPGQLQPPVEVQRLGFLGRRGFRPAAGCARSGCGSARRPLPRDPSTVHHGSFPFGSCTRRGGVRRDCTVVRAGCRRTRLVSAARPGRPSQPDGAHLGAGQGHGRTHQRPRVLAGLQGQVPGWGTAACSSQRGATTSTPPCSSSCAGRGRPR